MTSVNELLWKMQWEIACHDYHLLEIKISQRRDLTRLRIMVLQSVMKPCEVAGGQMTFSVCVFVSTWLEGNLVSLAAASAFVCEW